MREAREHRGWDLLEIAGGKSAYLGWAIAAFLGLLAFLYAISEREILGPYVRGTKIVLRNLPLWFMFLACVLMLVVILLPYTTKTRQLVIDHALSYLLLLLVGFLIYIMLLMSLRASLAPA